MQILSQFLIIQNPEQISVPTFIFFYNSKEDSLRKGNTNDFFFFLLSLLTIAFKRMDYIGDQYPVTLANPVKYICSLGGMS